MSLYSTTPATTPSSSFYSSAETPLHRHFGVSTDDAAIFMEDTVDRSTAQCIDASPSAIAILSPQRLPPPSSTSSLAEILEYDNFHSNSYSTTTCATTGGAGGAEEDRARESGEDEGDARADFGHFREEEDGRGEATAQPASCSAALHDVTNTVGAKQRRGSASPVPRASRRSTVSASRHASLCRHTPPRPSQMRSPSASEKAVSLAAYEKVHRELTRTRKMYEHQRTLYEEMASQQSKTYEMLQEKIVNVIALSTRNEESKRFIRQLKKEVSESRTRVMDIENRAMEDARAEQAAKQRCNALLEEQERRYETLVERHQTKTAGMESLVKDLTSLRDSTGTDRVSIAQLDGLLRAAYAKSTALLSDLMRKNRQIDLVYSAKADVERQLAQTRREKLMMEQLLEDERHCMAAETERFIEQIDEQQHAILNLRQLLIRTMDYPGLDNDGSHSCSSGSDDEDAAMAECNEEEEEDGKDGQGGMVRLLRCTAPSVSQTAPLRRGTRASSSDNIVDDSRASEEAAVEAEKPRRSAVLRTGGSQEGRVASSAAALMSNSVVAPSQHVDAAIRAKRTPLLQRLEDEGRASEALPPPPGVAPPPPLASTSRTFLSFLNKATALHSYHGAAPPRKNGDDDDREDEETSTASTSVSTVAKCVSSISVKKRDSDGLKRSVARPASPSTTSVLPRRRTDVSTALFAVAEKRRRDREAVAVAAAASTTTGKISEGAAIDAAEKENRLGQRRAPTCLTRAATKASSSSSQSSSSATRRRLVEVGSHDSEEDNDEIPKLFPRGGSTSAELIDAQRKV